VCSTRSNCENWRELQSKQPFHIGVFYKIERALNQAFYSVV